MIPIVTDASPWLAYFCGAGCLPLELGLAAGAIRVPPLVVAELLGNTLLPKERRGLEEVLRPLALLDLHPSHWERAGELKAILAGREQCLSARDAHILQCAIDQRAVLLSSDPWLASIQKSSGVTVQMW